MRRRILEQYGVDNFTDVTMNVAFTILGWLAGGGDFSQSICVAANCGKDTDCTAATVGALMGILDPGCIDDRWLAPIGRDLVINAAITGIAPPKTLGGFTDLVVALKDRLADDIEEPPPADGPLPHVAATLAFVDALPDVWPGEDTAIPAGSPPERFSGFRPPPPAPGRPVRLAGTFHSMPAAAFEAEFALLRYTATLHAARRVRVMLNADTAYAVWLDGGPAFARHGGPLIPSFHRLWGDMWADVDWPAGGHEITVVLLRPPAGTTASWVVGVADAATHQWLHDALHDALHRAGGVGNTLP